MIKLVILGEDAQALRLAQEIANQAKEFQVQRDGPFTYPSDILVFSASQSDPVGGIVVGEDIIIASPKGSVMPIPAKRAIAIQRGPKPRRENRPHEEVVAHVVSRIRECVSRNTWI